jgi:hypothetical protein
MKATLLVALLPTLSGFLLPLPRHKSSLTSNHNWEFFSNVGIYGRGAEIWPECNDIPIQLQDSFSQLPRDISVATLSKSEESNRQRPIRPKIILSIRIAAVAILLLRTIQPLDILMSIAFGGYFTILHVLAKSPRFLDDVASSPLLPTYPPQGHVPALVQNPLGLSWTNSNQYDLWLQIGSVLGLWIPLIMILKFNLFPPANIASIDLMAAKACTRPLFLLCSQHIIESISRRFMVSSLL